MSYCVDYPIVLVPRSFSGSFFEMNKKEAEEYFRWFIKQIDYRIQLLEDNMTNCDLNYKRDSFLCLYNWFERNVSYRKMTNQEIEEEKENIIDLLKENIDVGEETFTDETVSICFDIGIYLGESIRNAVEGVNWTFDTSSKKHINYAQPTLKKDGIKVELNPKNIMEILARKTIEGRAKESALMDLYDTWVKFFK